MYKWDKALSFADVYLCVSGSFQDSGDVSTHPSLRPSPNPAPIQTLDLTQGRVGASPETWIDASFLGQSFRVTPMTRRNETINSYLSTAVDVQTGCKRAINFTHLQLFRWSWFCFIGLRKASRWSVFSRQMEEYLEKENGSKASNTRALRHDSCYQAANKIHPHS